jgi:flagellar biosynthesis GTPase FlhF
MKTDNFVESVAEISPVSVEGISPEITAQADQYSAYTGDDIAKAREQEKAKLYPQIDRMKEEIATLKREKEEREAAEAAKRAEKDAAAKKREEDDMEIRDLLAKKEQEWNSQLETEKAERERAFAMLELERQYSDVQNYRNSRIDSERESIIPELLDLVNGNSKDEIEASIASLKERSARILESAQQAMTSARRDMVGTRTTVPASGPLDIDPENRQFSPEDIKNMSLSDYQKYRDRLLGPASSNRGRGLFG